MHVAVVEVVDAMSSRCAGVKCNTVGLGGLVYDIGGEPSKVTGVKDLHLECLNASG